MRELFTGREAAERGIDRSALRWGERRGRWRRVVRDVWAVGPDEPSELDRARAHVVAAGGVQAGRLAGVLLGLDGVTLGPGPKMIVPPEVSGRRPGAVRRSLPATSVIRVGGQPCTNGLETLVDLARCCDDVRWEQALESGLRKRLVTVPEIVAALPALGAARTSGVSRMRRVLAMRPDGAPPTESLLETLLVQLAREVPGLPPPVRQLRIVDEHGAFVARVDLCWPDLGLFVELDGQAHLGQPVYDARRETAVVAVTGWLCGRFTWHEVVHLPETTARRLADLARQARRRPMVA